ncbi:DNA methyltransferase [Chryseobacterium arthrosphaerae]|uniref:Methyltransferase n=1 Tax=Chryseobacterium arthrosphaerae TaxID=651561 RepID=A0ABU7R5Z3_9FLAO
MNITEKIAITNEDNMDLMVRYPDNYFDLAIVDPPYGINVSKMQYTQADNRKATQKNGSSLKVKKLNYEHKEWDNETPKQEYFDELFRVSKNQIIWGVNYMPILLNGGRIVWNKLNGDNSFSDSEIAYCSLQNKVSAFDFIWSGMIQGFDAVNGRKQQGNKKLNEKRIHPTQKPVKLYSWLLDKYAKPGDKILDTHLGSGSIAIACHDYGFELTACELDTDYYNNAIKRIKNHVSQLAIEEFK